MAEEKILFGKTKYKGSRVMANIRHARNKRAFEKYHGVGNAKTQATVKPGKWSINRGTGVRTMESGGAQATQSAPAPKTVKIAGTSAPSNAPRPPSSAGATPPPSRTVVIKPAIVPGDDRAKNLAIASAATGAAVAVGGYAGVRAALGRYRERVQKAAKSTRRVRGARTATKPTVAPKTARIARVAAAKTSTPAPKAPEGGTPKPVTSPAPKPATTGKNPTGITRVKAGAEKPTPKLGTTSKPAKTADQIIADVKKQRESRISATEAPAASRAASKAGAHKGFAKSTPRTSTPAPTTSVAPPPTGERAVGSTASQAIQQQSSESVGQSVVKRISKARRKAAAQVGPEVVHKTTGPQVIRKVKKIPVKSVSEAVTEVAQAGKKTGRVLIGEGREFGIKLKGGVEEAIRAIFPQGIKQEAMSKGGDIIGPATNKPVATAAAPKPSPAPKSVRAAVRKAEKTSKEITLPQVKETTKAEEVVSHAKTSRTRAKKIAARAAARRASRIAEQELAGPSQALSKAASRRAEIEKFIKEKGVKVVSEEGKEIKVPAGRAAKLLARHGAIAPSVAPASVEAEARMAARLKRAGTKSLRALGPVGMILQSLGLMETKKEKERKRKRGFI